MSISFDDFRDQFDARDISEDVAVMQFELIVRIMDAFVRLAWGDDPVEDALGINQTIDSHGLIESVEWEKSLLEPKDQAADSGQEG